MHADGSAQCAGPLGVYGATSFTLGYVEPLVAARLRTFLEAAAALSSEREPDVVLGRIVDVARDVVGARYAALAVWTGSRIRDFITSGLTAREILLIGELPEGHGLLGAVPAAAKPVRLPDLTADPRSVGFPPNHPPMHSFLGVPVEYKGEILGHLYLTEKREAPEFTAEDELLATGLASMAAVALTNARWAEGEQRRIAELEDLDRVRRDFVAVASHELAQPVTVVQGFLQTVVDQWGDMGDERRRELIDRALRNARELSSRLETALDVTRMDDGELQITVEDTDLAVVAADTVGLLPLDDQRRITVAARPAPCPGDRRRLGRVVSNLITNALKYSPPDTTVEVETAPSGDGVELIVVDRGIGFTADQRDRLFDRYYRTATAVASAAGIGLGLYASQQIAIAHGGLITADSAGPDRGSVFRLWLPAHTADDGVPDAAGGELRPTEVVGPGLD